MTAIHLSQVTKTFRIPSAEGRTVRGSFFTYLQGRQHGTQILTALDHISLDIQQGEFFGLIGPNGSGKSTLLRMMAGIYAPDSGKIETEGMVLPLLDLGIGFREELPARDNVFLSGVILGLSRRDIAAKLPAIIDFSELHSFMNAPLNHFSSGMKLRLGFALAVQIPAPTLLLDEFLFIGDESFRAKCETEFVRLHREGRTVVLASHDLAAIEKWCDRAAYLTGGRLVTTGRPREVIEQYHQRESYARH